LDGERPRQPRHRRLARAVGRHLHQSDERRDRSDADQPSRSARDHRLREDLIRAKHARQVRIENLLPVPFAHLQRRHPPGGAGGSDDDVDAAERVQTGIAQRAQRRRVADVGRHAQAVYFNGAVGEKPRDACGGAMLVVTRRLLVLTLLALASSAAVLFAQSVSGSVSGTVVDQTRQVLPGATVTLLNEQTGDSRAIQTSDVGAFVFPAVQPGVYTVRIELSGFSPFERKNTVVPANEQLSIG